MTFSSSECKTGHEPSGSAAPRPHKNHNVDSNIPCNTNTRTQSNSASKQSAAEYDSQSLYSSKSAKATMGPLVNNGAATLFPMGPEAFVIDCSSNTGSNSFGLNDPSSLVTSQRRGSITHDSASGFEKSLPANCGRRPSRVSVRISNKHFDDVDSVHAASESDVSIRQAGLMSSVANLVSTTIGPGILSLPAAFAATGWAMGSGLLALGGLGAMLGLHYLSKCAHKVGGTDTSFGRVAMTVLPAFSILCDLAVSLNCFVGAVPYLIVVGDLVPGICQTIVGMDNGSIYMSRRFWITVTCFGVGAPLCLLNNINGLRFTSSTAVASIMYIVFLSVLFVVQPGNLPGLDPCEGRVLDAAGECKGNVTAIESVGLPHIKALSIFVFAFACHPIIFNVYNEVRRPSVGFMNRIISVWMVLVSIVYSLFGLCGYLTYGSSVSSNILSDWPLTVPAAIGRSVICFVVAVAYPLVMHPARQAVVHLTNTLLTMNGKEEMTRPGHRLQWYLHWGGCWAYIFFTYSLAMVVTDLGIVFAVLGCSDGILTCYIIPGLLYWKMFKDDTDARATRKSRLMLYGALGMVVFGVLYMPLGIVSCFV